jgi:hypothetical protein
MNDKLRPTGFLVVYAIALCEKRAGVLVALRKVTWREADDLHLEWELAPVVLGYELY